jgi:hypothetical protein
MPELDVVRSPELLPQLFASSERWGWQFREPAAPRSHPEAGRPPVWSGPAHPDLFELQRKYDEGRANAVKRGAIVAVVLVLGISLQSAASIVPVLIALGLAAFWFGPMFTAQQQIDQLTADYERASRNENARQNGRMAAWQSSLQAWDLQESSRVATANLWFPIRPRLAPRRLDIFGGTPDGWAAFLLTMGASVLQSGAPVCVVDLSEHDVAAPLLAAAGAVGISSGRQALPAQLAEAHLLRGLDADEVADIVAEALHTRKQAAEADSRSLDGDIVKSVGERLNGHITLARLAAGLRVLERTAERPGRDGALSGEEFARLAEQVDVANDTEERKRRLQEVRSSIESLVPRGSTEGEAPAGTAPSPGLSVLVTDDHITRRRDMVDRLVIQSLRHRLRRNGAEFAGGLVVVAGADHIGREALEALVKAAARAGARLMLMIEHLTDDYERLLTGTSVFMRIGNHAEAERAANYIGREHTFKLAQLSRTQGSTTTTGTNTSRGTSSNVSQTSGTSGGKHGSGWSDSAGTSEGTTFQTGSNESYAESLTDGATHSRVYEFRIEPDRFQDLDNASFVMVESLETGGRLVTAGTCDPAVLALDRVADTEFTDTEFTGAAQAASPTAASPQPSRAGRTPRQVLIADPSRQLEHIAQKLIGHGYQVAYKQDDRPTMSGWLITGHRDGRALDESEIMSIGAGIGHPLPGT